MTATYHPLAIFTGSAHPGLGQAVADQLGVPLGKATTTRLPDSEIHVMIDEVVRDKEVFYIQSFARPVNDSLMELLLYMDAFRRASAHAVSVVAPYFPYARQERMARGREAISARVVADMIEQSGARRVMYVDIHNNAIQGFFHIPADPLTALPTLAGYFRKPEFAEAAIVSPDVGRANLAGKYANLLGLPLVILHKRRLGYSETRTSHVVGSIEGLRPIIIDDIIAGGSVLKQLDALYDSGAAGRACFAITHPVLLPSAIDRIAADERIERVVVTDTLPLAPDQHHDKIVVLSIAPLIAEVIERIYKGETISDKLVLT
jgi:ribose-phosphate pyrophosphokinase